MMKDNLSEFEQIEYYKKRLKGKAGFAFVIAVLMFLLGFAVARFLYLLGFMS